MPTFKGKENMPPQELLPKGDYPFEVVDWGRAISKGKSTRGADTYELKVRVNDTNTVYETLIDHESTDWKIDCFLRCTGVELKVGQSFEFGEDPGQVNPKGLRGWCAVVVDEYIPEGKTIAKKKNKIGTFYTDKPKIPRRVETAAEPTQADNEFGDPEAGGEGNPF